MIENKDNLNINVNISTFFLLEENIFWIFEPCFLQVTAGFQTTNMLTALPSSFLEPLLSFSLNEDPEVRLLVLQILLSLIDRHDNAAKFSNIRSVGIKGNFIRATSLML